MTVYVDAAIHSWKGKKWCHLFSPNLQELHAFAKELGLSRSWFQAPPKASWPHYDITAAKRATALAMGAVAAGRAKTLEVAYTHQYDRLGEPIPASRLKLIETARQQESQP